MSSQPAVPEWARYIAVDADGDVCAFEIRPTWSATEGWLTTGRMDVLFTGPNRPDASTTLFTIKHNEHGTKK